jgi:RHS repeat-associated protein
MRQRISPGNTLDITYNYDNQPELIKKNGNNFIGLTYDGNGQRVKKYNHQSGQTALYFGQLYEKRDNIGIIQVFAGNQRIASIRSDGQTQSCHGNHLGSASVIADQNANKTESFEYHPFGTYLAYTDHAPSFPNVHHTYTDQEEDQEIGLYNYKARLYDPLLGRFITPDSIVPDPGDPQALNRYSYVLNNPMVYTDPSGHDFGMSLLIGAAIGALLAGMQSRWSLQSMVIGATIGAISGGVFSCASGAVGGSLASAIESGAMSSMTAGAISGAVGGAFSGGTSGFLFAAAYHGNILEGALIGAGFGAMIGGIVGGIGADTEATGVSNLKMYVDSKQIVKDIQAHRIPLNPEEGQLIVNVLETNWADIPYEYGGNSNSGIDCSHLIHRGYEDAGFPYKYSNVSSLPKNPRFNLVSGDPQIGDIGIWNTSKISHMLIYAPNGPQGMNVFTAHHTGGLPSGYSYLNNYVRKYGPATWYRYYK